VTSAEIREKFLNFFKARGHAIVPSSSLIPDDPSVLLTTAGVQQFKKYYTDELNPMKDFGSRRVVSAQRCFRTTDIESVGDETHLTFFEMLGNFSFGEYFKAEAIAWGYEFLIKELGFAPERLSATYFDGDQETLAELKKYFPESKIKVAGKEDNFWGPTGKEGPCGPTAEFYVDGLEVWNLVFNEFFCHGSREQYLAGKAKLEKLKQPGVDTGMGLERLTAVLNGTMDVYQTDLLKSLFDKFGSRVIADHLRGSIFLIGDGVRPSNKGAGYVLRRLLRRVIALKKDIDFKAAVRQLAELLKNDGEILAVLEGERQQFLKTLERGLKKLKEYSLITAKDAFALYQSYGLPFEVIKEMAGAAAKDLRREDFEAEFKKHQEISRAGLEKKFGGHGLLLDTGELRASNEEELKKVLRLHTVTHLLQQALRDILGSEVKQAGSDITAERTRFDFTFNRKLTPEEIRRVEEIVNQKVSDDLPVNFEEMPLEEAKKSGALSFFKEKYPTRVKVYYIGDSLKSAYSKEFCGGPHVRRTSEIGNFKILKEESVGAGLRRLRATIDFGN